MIFHNDPEKVVPITVRGALNAVKAAYAQPSVKRFVLTSSASAALGLLDDGITVTEDTWNEKAVEKAWSGPPYDLYRPVLVYEASNVQSEQAVWKYHEENLDSRQDLVVNTSESFFQDPKSPISADKKSCPKFHPGPQHRPC